MKLFKISFKYFLPLALSFFIIYLSYDHNKWISFWNFLNVPAAIPPFGDLDALNIFLSYKQQGFNPYFENPYSHPIHNVYIYPSVWLYIADFINLQNPKSFIFFSFLIFFVYFYIIIDLLYRFKNRKFIYFLFIYFFSTSNFLLIERLNVEIIIFCFIYFSLTCKNFILKNLYFILSFILKIFPLFSIFMFINKKKNFFSLLLFSLVYLIIFREEIFLISKNVIEFALIFAYGVTSITKAIYFYSMKFGYFINDDNYTIFKFSMIVLASIYALIIFLINFSFKPQKKFKVKINLEEKMFLAGGGIFIGTFILSANVDYRLIFLLLTLPYLLSQFSNKLIIIYFIILFICFNSLVFQTGDPYGFSFFLKAAVVYILKIIIFSINCYYFGIILNRFINLNFGFYKK